MLHFVIILISCSHGKLISVTLKKKSHFCFLIADHKSKEELIPKTETCSIGLTNIHTQKRSTAHWQLETEFIYHVQLTLQSLFGLCPPPPMAHALTTSTHIRTATASPTYVWVTWPSQVHKMTAIFCFAKKIHKISKKTNGVE